MQSEFEKKGDFRVNEPVPAPVVGNLRLVIITRVYTAQSLTFAPGFVLQAFF